MRGVGGDQRADPGVSVLDKTTAVPHAAHQPESGRCGHGGFIVRGCGAGREQSVGKPARRVRRTRARGSA